MRNQDLELTLLTPSAYLHEQRAGSGDEKVVDWPGECVACTALSGWG